MRDMPDDHYHSRDAADRNDANLVERLRKLIGHIGNECACRGRLDEALVHFSALEGRRMQRQHLARAQQHRERIEAILVFLRDIDDLIATEPDPTVYTELAQLFRDVAAIATEGAQALQNLNALRTDQDRKIA